MRDLIIAVLVFGSLPVILVRPYWGVIVWSWLAYMNPHRLTWGFAYSFEWSYIVAIATMTGFVFTSQKRWPPFSRLTWLWIAFIFWVSIATWFAYDVSESQSEWKRFIKVQFFTLITLFLMYDKRRLLLLIWAIVISLGFWGVKGGLFTIATGGNYRVMGPEYSFFSENNTTGLTLIMTLPLMWYLYTQLQHKYLRWGMLGAITLTGFSILASHSRGAFLAGAAMLIFLWIKSRYKLRTGLMLILALSVMVPFMPDHWFERMESIQEYDKDASSMGRINAWEFAYNYATDHPLTGGGFGVFRKELFARYAPDPYFVVDAHSIYFEVLGEQGFIGLLIFLLLLFSAFTAGNRIIRLSKDHTELTWAQDLAAMLQVSLVGYLVGGAFLGLAYFDLYYHFLAILILLQRIVMEKREELADAADMEMDSVPEEITTGSEPKDNKRASLITGMDAN